MFIIPFVFPVSIAICARIICQHLPLICAPNLRREYTARRLPGSCHSLRLPILLWTRNRITIWQTKQTRQGQRQILPACCSLCAVPNEATDERVYWGVAVKCVYNIYSWTVVTVQSTSSASWSLCFSFHRLSFLSIKTGMLGWLYMYLCKYLLYIFVISSSSSVDFACQLISLFFFS